MDSRQASASYPDYGAWAEMLASLSEKAARLGDAVGKRWPPRTGTAVLAELERERSRIARELHAGAGQPLAGMKFHLELLSDTPAMPEEARTTIERLQILNGQALDQVRAVSHRLHPPEWQEMKLEQAMEALIESSGLGRSLRLTKNLQALPVEPAHNVKVQTYRCAQECISNILRHSGATEATISLRAEGSQTILTLSDNGHGFDPATRTSGIGLRAIGENAASVNGSSVVTSSPDGTRIVVSLPLLNED